MCASPTASSEEQRQEEIDEVPGEAEDQPWEGEEFQEDERELGEEAVGEDSEPPPEEADSVFGVLQHGFFGCFRGLGDWSFGTSCGMNHPSVIRKSRLCKRPRLHPCQGEGAGSRINSEAKHVSTSGNKAMPA